MTKHRAELTRLLRARRPPDWSKLAAEFAPAGLRGVRGRMRDVETAEETWRRMQEAGARTKKTIRQNRLRRQGQEEAVTLRRR